MKKDHVDHVLGLWAREWPELDTRAMGITERLGRVTRYVDAESDASLAGFRLSRESWDVLSSLRRSGSPYQLSPTALYRGLMRTSGAITHRLRRLENAGLVARVSDPSDGRSMLVRLSAAGRRLVDNVAPIYASSQRDLVANLTTAEQRQLNGLLKKLVVDFEQQGPPPENPIIAQRMRRRNQRKNQS